jgi:hypothetical protein
MAQLTATSGADNAQPPLSPETDKRLDFKALQNTEIFKVTMNALHDPRLVDNIMYQKMLARLEGFYVTAEKYRLYGPTPKQEKMFKDSGFSWKYHIELHTCLKHLLLNATKQKNMKVLKLHLSEVYRWLLNKLF